MDIQHLRAFYEVARWKSFSKAAAALYLSQPAVSRQISSLETEIGLPLFVRMANHVSLTEPGRKLLAYAEEIIRTLEQANRTIQDLRDLRQGTVTVAADRYLSNYFLPRFAGEFHRRYPSLQLQIRSHPHGDLYNLLAGGEIDLAFFCGAEPADNLPLTLEPLYQERLFLVTPAKPGSRAALKTTGLANHTTAWNQQENPARNSFPDNARIAEVMAEYSPFLFPPLTDLFSKFKEFLPEEQSPADAAVTVDSLEGIKTFLLNGFGSSILPESLIKEELEQGALSGVPLNCTYPVILTYPKDFRLPHPALLFIGVIHKLIHK
ncbi:LysR family transcriptional regulator [Desulfosporosinus nitroreducens]|uniref:LysR family transcriptional regulator n=1 Tax=Desulfosporosinus nitroreducens TaxID=2018668 RepID=UPI00207CFB75|nr:LysR family transcriptional regulator [Desulfosporosinus nitroreducens]MCO1600198.1 LysR family transcriptional regulator [Desulfosporosinus nitroreducens]